MSLYSLNPIEFEDVDRQLAEQEQRREWAKLHGDGAMEWENDIERANKRIIKLEIELALLKGAMKYLETNKIPWIERELDQERARQWSKK